MCHVNAVGSARRERGGQSRGTGQCLPRPCPFTFYRVTLFMSFIAATVIREALYIYVLTCLLPVSSTGREAP